MTTHQDQGFEEKLKNYFDAWYREQSEMTPYIMRDWFIGRISEEVERRVKEAMKQENFTFVCPHHNDGEALMPFEWIINTN